MISSNQIKEAITQFTKPILEFWDMLELSYAGVGELQSYRNFNDFLKKKDILWKLLYLKMEIYCLALHIEE